MAQPKDIDDIIFACRQKVVQRAAESFDDTISTFRTVCESPIEIGLLAGFSLIESTDGFSGYGGLRIEFTEQPDEYPPDASSGIHVYLQGNVGPYRADFIVDLVFAGRVERAVVECDGHDFHERTKEQAERDKSRDRSLAGAGFTVLRYTGREIWRSPERCALDCINTLIKRVGK